MTEPIRVTCLINRYWSPSTMSWEGETVNGTLIDLSTQSAEDNSGKLIPVGIVVLDGSDTEASVFQSVPVEFIRKI